MKRFKNNYLCYFLLFLFLQFFFSSFKCNKGLGGLDLRMHVKNNSAKAIYYTFSRNYPNVSIPAFNISRTPSDNKLESEKKIPIYLRDSWSHFLSNTPDEKLVFFFFDAKILESTKWDTVRKYNMFLSRKVLTLDSIKKTNWTVSYP